MLLRISRFTFLVGIVACLAARSQAASSTIFADEFNSTSLSSAWTVYGSDRSLSRTVFGNKPVFATEGTTKYMRLRLDTYNAQYPGTYLTGTEMHTKTQYALGNGVQLEARIRAPGLPAGIVYACFMLGEKGVWPDTYSRDEIDFENLTALSNGQVYTNIFKGFNPNTGSGKDSPLVITAPGLDRNTWATYKVRWYSDRVEWWINTGTVANPAPDILVRTETDPLLVCDDTESVRFNIWASDPSWNLAYGNLPVTNNKAQNTSYYFDVDYVHLTSIGTRGAVGTGDGLKAEYYDNADLTGLYTTRVDSKVNNDWGTSAPVPGMGGDTFSVRWSGLVQPSFSETYTFTTRTDDGVRLWVNNKLLIDQWNSQGLNEYSAAIAVRANTKYAIKMEYQENTGNASAKLLWSSPSIAKTIVPKTQLYSLYKPPVDKTAPTATISSPLNNYSYTALSQATGTAGDNVGLTYVTGQVHRLSDNTWWSGYTWVPSAYDVPLGTNDGWKNWTMPLPSMTDGQYSIRAKAKDAAGNLGYSALTNFFIDTTPPTITVKVPGNAVYPSAFPQANGTASDAVGVSSVSVILQRPDGLFWNGTTWVSSWTENLATGTTSWTYPLPALPTGYYNFWAVSRDYVGNYTYCQEIVFAIQ